MARPYLLSKKDLAYDDLGFEIYDSDVLSKLDNLEGESDIIDESDETDGDSNEKEEEKKPDGDKEQDDKGQSVVKPQNNYIGTIEIAKINLKKGFVSPKSKYNNINYNVTIIDGFDYPDVEKGNFILAAHSGTGPQSFFKNLYKLEKGDTVKITYNKKEYIYKITKIYTQKKQGYLTIYRNPNKTTLTLITCKHNTNKQLIVICELIEER